MKAYFTLDGGAERQVLSFRFSFAQPYDEFGRAVGRVQGGTIQVELELKEGDSSVPEWAADSTSVKNGSLLLKSVNSLATRKTIDFSDAYCVEYEEYYRPELGQIERPRPMIVKFTLSAKKLSVGGVEHENIWKDFD